jgi:methionyl-tRNA formyltransferase
MDGGGTVSAMVSMPEDMRPDNSTDLAGFARSHAISYHEISDINGKESLELLGILAPDYIFCSWPKMLKQEVLELPACFVIGSHPTDLPFNRGRHPLHWLICQGIEESQVSFFHMDEGVDSGDLLLQIPYKIASDTSIEALDALVDEAAYEGAKQLAARLDGNSKFSGDEQDISLANTWRKRTPYDVTIDLRMSLNTIMNTVRSYSAPYPCANLLFRTDVIKITGARPSSHSGGLTLEQLQRIEPGRIIAVADNILSVKAEDGIVDLECAPPLPERLKTAKYIHPPGFYLANSPNLVSG